MPNRLQNMVFLLATIMLISTALYFTKNIMIPFVFAVFFVYSIQPAISWIQSKLKVNRYISIILLLLFLFILSGLCFILIGSSIKQIVQNSNQYQQRVLQLLGSTTAFLRQQNLPIDLNDNLQQFVNEIPIFGFLTKISQSLVKSISDFSLVAIFSLFLLSGRPLKVPDVGIFKTVNRNIRSYLLTKVLTSTVTGVLTGIFLVLIDLDMAIMFGFLAFLLNFIPTIGSVFATLLPLPIAILQFTNPWLMGAVLLVPGTIQFSVGNVIEPKLMGQSLDLHPVSILLSLMFWGFLWGVPGMLLATPITVILKQLLSTSEQYREYAELLAGRIDFSEEGAGNSQ